MTELNQGPIYGSKYKTIHQKILPETLIYEFNRIFILCISNHYLATLL